ncbi:MAG: hypothetical protein EZS28_038460, partial [Streblomastix strix]
EPVVVCSINFVDLAGNERVAVSKSSGERLKEAQQINKSLSALGDVICALSKQQGSKQQSQQNQMNSLNELKKQNNKNQRGGSVGRNEKSKLALGALGGSSKTLLFINIAAQSDEDINDDGIDSQERQSIPSEDEFNDEQEDDEEEPVDLYVSTGETINSLEFGARVRKVRNKIGIV